MRLLFGRTHRNQPTCSGGQSPDRRPPDRCHVCGSTEALQKQVRKVFDLGGRRVLVEDIPAQVCIRCGEATFSRETTERIRRMVHGEAKPVREEKVDVFAFV